MSPVACALPNPKPGPPSSPDSAFRWSRHSRPFRPLVNMFFSRLPRRHDLLLFLLPQWPLLSRGLLLPSPSTRPGLRPQIVWCFSPRLSLGDAVWSHGVTCDPSHGHVPGPHPSLDSRLVARSVTLHLHPHTSEAELCAFALGQLPLASSACRRRTPSSS